MRGWLRRLPGLLLRLRLQSWTPPFIKRSSPKSNKSCERLNSELLTQNRLLRREQDKVKNQNKQIESIKSARLALVAELEIANARLSPEVVVRDDIEELEELVGNFSELSGII